jgi:Universal stress protein family
MPIVLAALDASPTATGVLRTAVAVGELLDAPVTAIHVREGSIDVPAAVAAEQRVPLRILELPVEAALLAAISDPNACAGVFGARLAPAAVPPIGHIALRVLERTTKPIVVVPPGSTTGRRLRRLLVPLEGTEASARAVTESLTPLLRAGVELVALHVFTPATVPRGLDRPARDLSCLGDEFVARFLPEAARIGLRTGPVVARVAEAVAEIDADLIVLSWGQDTSPGRARVIWDVLGSATVPVLLLPVRPAAAEIGTERRVSPGRS